MYKGKFLENWGEMTSLKKPVIAAVSGYAVRISFSHQITETFIMCVHSLEVVAN